MKLRLIVGILVGLLGVSLYLAAVKRSTPAPTQAAVIVIAEEPKLTPTPLAIQQVVDVTNIDDLLDHDRMIVHDPFYPSELPLVGPKRIAIEGSTVGPDLVRENKPLVVQIPVLTSVGYEEVVPAAPDPVDVTPIPKALEESIGPCGNEEIFRSEPGASEPGALLLDRNAVTAPRVQPRLANENFPALGAWNFDQPPSVAKPTAFEVHAKATSLAPLFFLSDSDLLERGSHSDPDLRFENAQVLYRGVDNGMREDLPAQLPNAHHEVVLRATSLQSSASQAPTSRLDWFTRWYGDDRLPCRSLRHKAIFCPPAIRE